MHLYPILTVLLFNSFFRGLSFVKEVSKILKNRFPTFVLTASFQGGLNHVTSLVLHFLPLLGGVVCGGLKDNWKLYPLLFSASWYTGTSSSNTEPFEDNLLSLSFTALGMFSFICFGWLLRWWTYNGVWFGFRKGLCSTPAQTFQYTWWQLTRRPCTSQGQGWPWSQDHHHGSWFCEWKL